MDSVIVEYLIIVNKNQQSGNNVYEWQLADVDPERDSYDSYLNYENNILNDITNQNNDDNRILISNNHIITLFIDNLVKNYLFDMMKNKKYSTITELNEDLILNTIDYDYINQIILEYIDRALEYWKTQIDSLFNQGNNQFYIHLNYNQHMYYSKIDEIKEYIHDKLIEFNF